MPISYQSTNASTLPPELQGAINQNLIDAQGAAAAAGSPSSMPGSYANGDLSARNAGFTGLQQQAQAGIAGLQQPGQIAAGTNMLNQQDINGQFQPGISNLGGAAQGIAAIQQPGQFNQATGATQGALGQNWTNQGTASQYMNPYQQNVTDIAKREAARQSDIQGTKDSAAFGSAGAFGGSRQGIVDAERERNLSQQQNDIQMQGANQAYNSGMSQFNADRSNQLTGAGQLANIGGQQFNAQMAQQQGLAGVAAQQTGAAGALSGAQNTQANSMLGAGQTQQQTDLGRLNAQQTTGGIQQAQNQQNLNTAFGNWQAEKNAPMANQAWLSGIINGTPMAQNSITTQYAPSPNLTGQLTGLGIAGLGAYGAMQNAYGGSSGGGMGGTAH